MSCPMCSPRGTPDPRLSFCPWCDDDWHRHRFTPQQRERVIAAAIGTQALSGFALSRETAEAAFAAAMNKPLPPIG